MGGRWGGRCGGGQCLILSFFPVFLKMEGGGGDGMEEGSVRRHEPVSFFILCKQEGGEALLLSGHRRLGVFCV